jgi:hypothetical protein
MSNIFQDKTPMPPTKEVVSVVMCHEETPPGTPRLSGEKNFPDNAVRNLERPRRGHGY